MSPYSIAIDGPSGSGKTTISKIIADNNKLLFISSGTLYRIAANFIDRNDSNNEIINKLEKINLVYKDKIFYVNGNDISNKLIRNEISLLASYFATNVNVRNFVNKELKKLSQKNDVIIDGRDIGTKVLPNANLKIFLTTSIIARVIRRKNQLLINNEKINFFKTYLTILKRDWNDSKRKLDPLKKPKDAIVVSTNNRSIKEVVKIIQGHIKRKE